MTYLKKQCSTFSYKVSLADKCSFVALGYLDSVSTCRIDDEGSIPADRSRLSHEIEQITGQSYKGYYGRLLTFLSWFESTLSR